MELHGGEELTRMVTEKNGDMHCQDFDNTFFDHGANYTGMPNTDPDADPCDTEGMGDVGGQGHVPIWNALLDSEEFVEDYINRWADLGNSYFLVIL